MKPATFRYVRPSSLEEAMSALRQHGGDAKILAGGQSLMPLLNFRMLRPAALIDINRIPGLDYVTETDDGGIRIGSLTRHYTLETSPAIWGRFPIMQTAVTHVAHLAIRNRGTIGGSLSHADPAAELPMMALLLDAELVIASAVGARTVAAEDFFVSALTNCLDPDQIVFEIDFPVLTSHAGWAFEEVARRFGDFALASIAVSLEILDGRIVDARVAVMGVADTPRRLRQAEDALRGEGEPKTAAKFGKIVRACVSPESDIHVSAEYRKNLVGELAERAFTTAWASAMGAKP